MADHQAQGRAAIKNLKPADLPAPPQAAARIVQACGDPDVSAQALSRIVASDPILTAEILRTVNSAFFGLAREVKSAAHAVAVLGNRVLRNLALCLAVRDALKPDAIPGFDMLTYWEDALRRAVGAKLIAKQVGFDPDEAFTIGLLQDFGMLAMIFAMPDLAAHWPQLRPALPEDRRRMEHKIFGITHDKVGLMLAKTWSLPGGLAMPMACHHSLDADGLPEHHRQACAIALGADWVCAVYSSDDKKAAIERCRVLIEGNLGLGMERVDGILDELPHGVEEAANSLGLRVEVQPKLEEIMREANRRLVEENMSYQELTRRLQMTLDEKERLAQKLKEANERLEAMAYFDPLTNLVNRRRFHEVFPAEIARHSRNGQSLSLVMIDLDKFKSVNDNYGHPFGDTVLESVAQVLRDTLRTTDIKARIGGEEMVIVLPETDEAAGQRSIERVRAAIEGMVLCTPTRRVPITASFGGCTWSGTVKTKEDVERIAKHLMDQADGGLYEAKHGGRNQVRWRPYEG